MTLADELERAVARASALAPAGATVTAVLAAEPVPGARGYLCAFEQVDGVRAWLVLDREGRPVRRRREVRGTVTIAALCELAQDTAGGGDLNELRSQLVSLRLGERPPGIEEAEKALLELQRTLGSPPQLATPQRLDAIGAAVRRLEHALDPAAASPFAAAMIAAQGVVDELARDVESSYAVELD